MKNLIIIALILFVTLTKAFANHGEIKKGRTTNYYKIEDMDVMNPDAVLKTSPKCLYSMAAENKMIVGEGEPELASVKKSLEEIILEDNRIIDSRPFEYYTIAPLAP